MKGALISIHVFAPRVLVLLVITMAINVDGDNGCDDGDDDNEICVVPR